MTTKKVIPLHLGPVFAGFNGLYSQLSAFLDTIKNAKPGQPVITQPSPQAAKLGLGPTTSTPDLKTARATAYSQAGNGITKYGSPDPTTGQPPIVSQTDGAKQVIQKFVQTLSTTTVGYLSGIGFTNGSPPPAPPTLTSNQNDVVNNVYSAWDKSAGKYMKGDSSGGDTARDDLQTLLKAYDTAIKTQGKTPAPKPS